LLYYDGHRGHLAFLLFRDVLRVGCACGERLGCNGPVGNHLHPRRRISLHGPHSSNLFKAQDPSLARLARVQFFPRNSSVRRCLYHWSQPLLVGLLCSLRVGEHTLSWFFLRLDGIEPPTLLARISCAGARRRKTEKQGIVRRLLHSLSRILRLSRGLCHTLLSVRLSSRARFHYPDRASGMAL